MQPRLRSWMPAADRITAPGTRASMQVRTSSAAARGSFLRASSASSSASRLAKDRSFIRVLQGADPVRLCLRRTCERKRTFRFCSDYQQGWLSGGAVASGRDVDTRPTCRLALRKPCVLRGVPLGGTMKLQLAAALCALMTLPACATMTRGTNTAWEVTSTPSGARVETSNGFQCAATPCSIRMPRRSEFVATLTRDGYEPATITVTNKVATAGGVAMAGNVLVGGLIGAGVDAGTGAMLDLTPNPAHVDLTPE